MKHSVTALALALLVQGLSATAAEPPAATDSLTSLPTPPAATVKLGEAMKLDDGRVCKSTMRANFYTPTDGRLDAAIAWYAAHLAGFKRTHGYWSGRSQDTFYNATGTQMVSITGNPAKQGENTGVYSILYATVDPGFAEKTIQSLNAEKVICP